MVVSNLDRLGELEKLGGKRHKFPAKGGTHSGRWCSGNLKAAVQDSVTANIEETTGAKNLAHTHKITGKKKITVHNGLVVGDEVILIRQQEGQKFIVWDRIGK